MLVYVIIIAGLVFGLLHLIRLHSLIKMIRKINNRISDRNSLITLNSIWVSSTYIPYASVEKSCANLKWYNPFNYNFREIITHE